MRILLVTNDFPTPIQPTRGMFNAQMAAALAASHRVTVLCPVSWVDEWRGRSFHGFPRHLVSDVEVYHPRYYYPPGVWRAAYGSFLWWSARRVARRIVSDFQPEIVLGYWLHPDGDVALRIAREAGVPGVAMSGGSDVLMLTRDAGRRRKIVDVLRRADAVVTVSRHLKGAVGALGADEAKVHVIQRGVDLARFSPGDRLEAGRRLGLAADRPMLLWVGRFVPVKGLDVLIDAVGELAREGLDLHVHLIGDGPLGAQLAERARRRDVADRVVFAGRVPHASLVDWYRAANLTVLPSRSEGIPNMLLELIACGTPFVASAVGGVPEIADPDLDLLVKPDDVAGLAAAIRHGLDRRRAGPGPRRFMPGSWRASASALGALFAELVPGTSSRGQAPDR